MKLESAEHLLVYAPLLAMVATAAVTDVRGRRIPNWLTLAAVVTGLAQSFAPWGVITPAAALLGLAVGFGATFLLYCIGARGAGDVKLTAGVGAWVGPVGVLAVLAAAAVVSLVVAVVRTAASGRLTDLLRNSALMVVNVANVQRLGTRHVMETGQQSPPSIDRPMPNAVSMLLATIGVVMWVSQVRG